MAYPHTIANGQNPSGTKLQANFDYVLGLISGGQAIKSDTLANLHAAAMAAPTVAFLGIPTDLKALLLYTGVAAAGPEGNGFVTLASWEVIS
jgi:hypothetical protein